MLPAGESTTQPPAAPKRTQAGAGKTRVQWCTVFQDVAWMAVSTAAPQPCNCLPATQTHAVVSSRTEIPVPGLVSGSRMPESSYYGAVAGTHILGSAAGAQQLACSSWLKVAQHGISLLATQVSFSSTSHPPIYFCLPALLLCPNICQAQEFFPCRVKSWCFGRQHLIPTHRRADFEVC